MHKVTLVFLLVLASNAFGEGPIDQVDIHIETFRKNEESKVFYQDNEIGTKITISNNSTTALDLEVVYELDSAEGEFEAIQKTWLSDGPVAAGESAYFLGSFQLPGDAEISSGTFIVKARAKVAGYPGPDNVVTGNSFITIFSGTGNNAPTNVDETSFFLLPIIGFMALFLLRKKPSF